MKVVAILILMAATLTASAEVGENEKQVEARYGKPAKIMTEKGKFRVVGYLSHGFMVLVDYIDGTSKREAFATPNTSPLSKNDIDQILALTAGPGLTWEELPQKDGARYWNRSDWKIIATMSADGKFLSVRDPNFVPPQ